MVRIIPVDGRDNLATQLPQTVTHYNWQARNDLALNCLKLEHVIPDEREMAKPHNCLKL